MADAPSAEDLFQVGRAEALTLPTKFDPAIIDAEGSDVNVVFRVSAAMGEEVARFILLATNELSLSNAREEKLDRWVFDRYQITRRRAAAAVVTLQLQRNGSAGITVDRGSSFGTEDGVVFTTQTPVVFAANQIGPLSVLATAVTAGVEGNVAAGTITQVLSAVGDATMVVTNPEPAAGGTVDETDDELKDRARQFFLTARRGTQAAIEFGATQADGVVQATAQESLDPTTGLAGYRVQLYVSDASGQANTALADRVRQILGEYRGLGVPVSVVPAVPQYVTITAKGLQFEAGANTSEVLDRAASAILATVNGLAPGTTLRRAALLGALAQVNQLIVPDGALTAPVGDLVPATGSVIRTTRDRIQLTG